MSVRPRGPTGQTHAVLIQNLPDDVVEAKLKSAFSHLGPIHSIHFKNSGTNRRQVFINFLYHGDAQRAVAEFNGKVWDKNIITVKYLEPRPFKLDKMIPVNMSNVRFMPPPVQRYPTPMPRASSMVPPHYRRTTYNKNPIPNQFMHPNMWSQSPQPNEVHPLDFNVLKNSKPLNKPEFRKVQCVRVEDVVTFYSLNRAHDSFLENLYFLLQQSCPSLPRLTKLPDESKLYGVLFESDIQWYRCVIKKRKRLGTFIVHLVDCGTIEEVKFYQLVQLPEMFNNFPYFAHKCVFANLIPRADEKGKAVDYLKERILNANITISTPSSQSSFDYIVLECYCESVDIVEWLVTKGYAVFKPGYSKQCADKEKIKSSASPSSLQSTEAVQNSSGSHSKEKITILKSNLSLKNEADLKAESWRLDHEVKLLKAELSDLRCERDFLKEQLAASMKNSQNVDAHGEDRKDPSLLYSVASHLQLVNSIRKTPTSMQDTDISECVNLIQFKDNSDYLSLIDQSKKIDETLASYNNALNNIRKCTEMENLNRLIVKKTMLLNDLCDQLRNFEKTTDPTTSHIKKLKEIIGILKHKQSVEKRDESEHNSLTLEEVLRQSEVSVKELSKNLENSQLDTNTAHSTFLLSMLKFEKIFHLCPGDSSVNGTAGIEDVNLQINHFFTAAKQLVLDMENEVNLSLFRKQKQQPAVVDCLIRELENLQKELLTISQFKNKCTSQLAELTKGSCELTVTKLVNIRNEIQATKSKLETVNSQMTEEDNASTSATDVIGLFRELHLLFYQEDELMGLLSSHFTTNYPELDYVNPELKISLYVKYHGVKKFSWNLKSFSLQKVKDNQMHVCCESTLLHQPVNIKEFTLDSENTMDNTLLRASQWSQISSHYLVSLLGCFQNNLQLYVIAPQQHSLASRDTPLKHTEYYTTLIAVLKGLDALHSHKFVHASVHPFNVLLKSKTALLDFPVHIQQLPSMNGITFRAPEFNEKSGASTACDMFSFACLVLWILFPHFEFKTLPSGTLDLLPVRDVIKESLSSQCFDVIVSLLDYRDNLRPSAKSLLQTKFLYEVSKLKSELKVQPFDAACHPVSKPDPSPKSSRKISVPNSTVNSLPLAQEESIKKPDIECNQVSSETPIPKTNNTLKMLFSMRQPIKLNSDGQTSMEIDKKDSDQVNERNGEKPNPSGESF